MQERGIIRNTSPVFQDKSTSGFMKVAGAAVVAEAFPEAQDFLLVGGSQVGDCGKHVQKTFEKRDDGGNLRLLQHDLANPDAVGIAVTPPWEIAPMRIEPCKQAPP